MNIAVFGLGYVGLASAVLLSERHTVKAVDLNAERVAAVNARISPLVDSELINYLASKPLDLTATTDAAAGLEAADYAIIATPTDYNTDSGYFDTRSVESVLGSIARLSPSTVAVIKSTVPVGFTQRMAERFPQLTILFSPEFLREGRALYDNLHPSRIIVAGDEAKSREFAGLLAEASLDADPTVLVTGTVEAEAIKLFSNTYLAMRVAYFNELDTFAAQHGLDAASIVNGVSLDPRIGQHYNNPSFGYGGYCLPKDTKQLLANYDGVPQTLISAIVESNDVRMDFIAKDILAKKPRVVGVYRLAMKSGSDNFRSSSIQVIMNHLAAAGTEIILFEPSARAEDFPGIELVADRDEFITRADVIIANRMSAELEDAGNKVYSRDIYRRD